MWDIVCKPKGKVWIGVRDLWLVNLSLLDKWRYRLIKYAYNIWCLILVTRYDAPTISSLPGWISGFQSFSFWWKDVSLLGFKEDDLCDWFFDGILKRVGVDPLEFFLGGFLGMIQPP